MNLNFGKLWDSAQHMIDSIMARLPSLVVAIAVFILFYILSIFVRRIIRRATRAHRQNLGMAFARLIGAGIILLGFLVAFSIVAPSFQAGDLIKVLGIGSVAIGFAFQKHSAEFSCRLAVVMGRTLSCG
jgi:small-conductance mechanosensitive channel